MFFSKIHVLVLFFLLTIISTIDANKWYSASDLEKPLNTTLPEGKFGRDYLQDIQKRYIPLNNVEKINKADNRRYLKTNFSMVQRRQVFFDINRNKLKSDDFQTFKNNNVNDTLVLQNSSFPPTYPVFKYNNTLYNINIVNTPKRKLIRKRCLPMRPSMLKYKQRQKKQMMNQKAKTRFLEVFEVVEFDHVPCTSSSGLEGICLPDQSCATSEATAMGICADGYGTCCVNVQCWTKACPKDFDDVQSCAACIQRLPATFTRSSLHRVGGCLRYAFRYAVATRELYYPNGHLFYELCAMPLQFSYFVSYVAQFSCDDQVAARTGWFVNPGFPSPSSERLSCVAIIHKASRDVIQMRLDFMNFELLPPTGGTCKEDQFVVSGQNMNNLLPILCGVNTGQHMYIEIGDVAGPITLSIQTVSSESRLFAIKVTQITPFDELVAPTGCLQYFRGYQGYLVSFNYRDKSDIAIARTPSYLNNLNYAMCIERVPSTCSVTYTNVGTMQIVNYDSDGLPVISPGQAGVETFNCPTDYILLAAIRLCGDRLNDGSVLQDFGLDAPVTDTSTGPIILWFRSNGGYAGRGFKLQYQQNSC